MRALVQAVLMLVPITAGAADVPHTGVTALVGATVIDGTGTGNSPREDAVVLVSGESIRAVGPRAEILIPEGARVVDVTGKWIIPGLVDTHIHLFQSGGLYKRPDIIDLRSVRPYAVEIERVRARLPMTLARYLASGVTAVLDVGGPFWTFGARKRSRRNLPVQHRGHARPDDGREVSLDATPAVESHTTRPARVSVFL